MSNKAVKPEEILGQVNNAHSLTVLADILALSCATEAPDTREILIAVPRDIAGVPDGVNLKKQLASMIAIALFHSLTVHPKNPDTFTIEALANEGRKSRFSEGGLLKLLANDDMAPEETIVVSDYKIPGYEKVCQIRFVSEIHQ
ncbi:MAG: hypothetical protein AAGF93_03735 [Cyanobacteria bacterium P01_H01_bin.105]